MQIPITELERRYPKSDSGNAEWFAQVFGHKVKFDYRQNKWLMFDAHYWRLMPKSAMLPVATEAVRLQQNQAVATITDPERRKGRLRWLLNSENHRRLVDMLALVQGLDPIADDGENWDIEPMLLGVPNGVVDLQTGKLRNGRLADRITMNTKVRGTTRT